MWEIVGVILAILGISVSIYFGVRRKRRQTTIRQRQAQTYRSRQHITLNGGGIDPSAIDQRQDDARDSDQNVKNRRP